ncbi:glycosyltransferase family 4 protein [Candidatus Nanohalococcus occultus]|uniref:glycosyltransferase family 4 protein n=1 Tax=Candidatus Nanohalococcus occultus TaxID=2978047 RepID=UPI0039E13321
MKVGFVVPKFPPNVSGGGEISAKLFAECYREEGIEVEVLSFDKCSVEATKDPSYVRRVAIESEREDYQNLLGYREIKKFASDKDVIHSYNMTFHPAVSRLDDVLTIATLNSYPYVYPNQIEGLELSPTFPPYRALFNVVARRMMKDIDCFVAVSGDVKKICSRLLPAAEIKVLPEMYDPEFPSFEGITTCQNELLYVGRLHESKGVSQIIDALEEMPKYKLRVVGKGQESQALREIVERRSLEDRVVFEGYLEQDELLRAYERAGWFIHPGKWPEPFGRTIIEAMQMETPVLATNKGGPKDILPEDQLFEEAGQVSEIIDQLDYEDVLSYQNELLDNYEPRRVVGRYINLYNRLL